MFLFLARRLTVIYFCTRVPLVSCCRDHNGFRSPLDALPYGQSSVIGEFYLKWIQSVGAARNSLVILTQQILVTSLGINGNLISKFTPTAWQTLYFKDQITIIGLTFWRRNYFFLILAHPVYKMWTIQELNMLHLCNKLHFEREKTESIHYV